MVVTIIVKDYKQRKNHHQLFECFIEAISMVMDFIIFDSFLRLLQQRDHLDQPMVANLKRKQRDLPSRLIISIAKHQ